MVGPVLRLGGKTPSPLLSGLDFMIRDHEGVSTCRRSVIYRVKKSVLKQTRSQWRELKWVWCDPVSGFQSKDERQCFGSSDVCHQVHGW